MSDFLVNDSFSVEPAQSSSNATSRLFYTSYKKGTQTGTTFHDGHATFTDAMIGGSLRFASHIDGKNYSFDAIVLSVDSPTTLTLDISQNISDTEYLLWYDGVQFNQQGTLSAKTLILNGEIMSHASFTNVAQVWLTNTGSTLYTPSDKAVYLLLEGVGGGGAGGGASAAAVAMGGGGGAGAYFKYLIEAQAFTYQCGTGGAGTSGATGNAGTATTIDDLPLGQISAGGGAGGIANSNTVGGQVALGGAGGTAANLARVTMSYAGEHGGPGWGDTTLSQCLGGKGGSTLFGAGGAGSALQTAAGQMAGIAATGWGAGGGGAAVVAGTAVGGGNGTQGAILVTVYSY